MSSANIFVVTLHCPIISRTSAVNTLKSRGEGTPPCGTPLIARLTVENEESTLAWNVLPERYWAILLLPMGPWDSVEWNFYFSSLNFSFSYGTLSNAFAMSFTSTSQGQSIASVQSFRHSSKLAWIDFLGINPCCCPWGHEISSGFLELGTKVSVW